MIALWPAPKELPKDLDQFEEEIARRLEQDEPIGDDAEMFHLLQDIASRIRENHPARLWFLFFDEELISKIEEPRLRPSPRDRKAFHYLTKALSRGLNVEVRQGRPDDVLLPRQSVDVIVMNGVHLGAGLEDPKYQRLTLPWLRSMTRALRPGGVMVMEDNNMDLLQHDVAGKVERAGLKHIILRQGPKHGLQPDQWVAVFRRP